MGGGGCGGGRGGGRELTSACICLNICADASSCFWMRSPTRESLLLPLPTVGGETSSPPMLRGGGPGVEAEAEAEAEAEVEAEAAAGEARGGCAAGGEEVAPDAAR